MKKQIAAGFIPYEIGDTVILKDRIGLFEIENIRFVQYLKECNCEFEVLLSFAGSIMEEWMHVNKIEKRIIE